MVDFKILNKIQEVEELLGRGQLIALTAPLILDHTVIVGFYNTSEDQGCIEVPQVEFNPLARLLFHPSRTKIAVHGLKRIWEYLNIGNSELDLDLVTDTKLMAYLLNPDAGREEAEGLSLSLSLTNILTRITRIWLWMYATWESVDPSTGPWYVMPAPSST